MDAVSTACRDEITRQGLAAESPLVFGAPETGYVEQVFYHTLRAQAGRCQATMVNPDKALAFTVEFDNKELPYLIHWKCKAAGDYVTGIEPSNCHPEGVVAPGEKLETDLRFSLAAGPDALAFLR